MDYEDEDKSWLPLMGTILLVLGAAGGGFYYLVYGAPQKEVAQPQLPAKSEQMAVQRASSFSPTDSIEESSEEILANLEVRVRDHDAKETAHQIAKILESGDLEKAVAAIGGEASGVSAEALRRLTQETVGQRFLLESLREVGELESNRRKRFALEWQAGEPPFFLDLTRGRDGRWEVTKMTLPPARDSQDTEQDLTSKPLTTKTTREEEVPDSLTVSDRFLQAALSQNFGQAKSFVNPKSVSDAKIAAMCILFEEGKYRLNPAKPLRAMFNRETTAGYLANVLTNDANQPAQFGVNLVRASPKEEWKVSEINLDSLLADYAGRVAGGDVYYTPLVPNPKGGETLVIFFGFDEETLAPRTQRQLAIVADVLTTNSNRKLTLSGHADALGTDAYNQQLSQKRATSVRQFLIENGVAESQIEIIAEGESRPRRPNETLTGDDNPDGRRANRRTEIYLDFGLR